MRLHRHFFGTLVVYRALSILTIHDCMPVIPHPDDYERWLSPEPGPHDLMKPLPRELMTMWPIGMDVGSPKNDRRDIADPIEAADDDDPEPTLL